jgi:hypothetical protein
MPCLVIGLHIASGDDPRSSANRAKCIWGLSQMTLILFPESPPKSFLHEARNVFSLSKRAEEPRPYVFILEIGQKGS